jgi:hypothetical protein
MPGLANNPQKESKKEPINDTNLDEQMSMVDKLQEEEMTQLDANKEAKSAHTDKLFALKRGKYLKRSKIKRFQVKHEFKNNAENLANNSKILDKDVHRKLFNDCIVHLLKNQVNFPSFTLNLLDQQNA